MRKTLSSPKFWLITVAIVLVAATRFLPHLPNFTPIAALALFGGAYFSRKWMAFVIPFAVMFATDIFIGFHSTLIYVYISFALIVGIGFLLRKRVSWLPVIGATLGGSVLFFVITNFGSFLAYDMYTKDINGLVTCYVAAIPFFRNAILGDLFYAGVLFGGFEMLQYAFPKLATAKVKA